MNGLYNFYDWALQLLSTILRAVKNWANNLRFHSVLFFSDKILFERFSGTLSAKPILAIIPKNSDPEAIISQLSPADRKELAVLVFDPGLRAALNKLEITNLHYKELWTNPDYDIAAHISTKQHVDLLQQKNEDTKLIYTEIFDQRVVVERILLFFNQIAVGKTKKLLLFSQNQKNMLTTLAAEWLRTDNCYMLMQGYFVTLTSNLLLSAQIRKYFSNKTISFRQTTLTYWQIFMRIYQPIKSFLKNIKKFCGIHKSEDQDRQQAADLSLKSQKNIKKKDAVVLKNSAMPLLCCVAGDVGSSYVKTALNLAKKCKKYRIPINFITQSRSTHGLFLLQGLNSYHYPSYEKPAYSHVTDQPSDGYKWEPYIQQKKVWQNKIDSILSQKQYKACLFLPHWSSIGFAMSELCKKYEIPAVSAPLVTVAGNAASIVGWNIMDKIFCYGKQCEEAFLKMQYPAEKLEAIGSIAMDNILETYSHHNKNAGKKFVLIATSRLDPDESQWIRRVADFCAKQNLECIIRPHPSFGKQAYADLKDINIHFQSEPNLGVAFKDCCLCITDASTMGATAVLLGIPVVLVNMTGKEFGANDYTHYGVALKVTHHDELDEKLYQAIYSPAQAEKFANSRPDFYADYNAYNDGQAMLRMLKALGYEL